MTTLLVQTEMNNSIAQGLDQLNNLNQQVFDYWYSELFDENDDPVMEKWTDQTLNEIEKDVMYNSSADWKMTKDLYTEITKSESIMNLTESQFDQLKESYAYMIVDDMDMKTLVQLGIDSIVENLKSYDQDELRDEIVELYDEEVLDNLLQEVITEGWTND